MKKKALIVVGGIVLVLAVLIWQVFANLDSIVAGVIEDVGSDVLKTEVSVSGVEIDLKASKAGIAGMTIANPGGYSSANLLEMEAIGVDIDLGSLDKDVLVINAIVIHNPKINFEGDADGGSNMQTLLDNINSGSSDDSATTSTEETKMIINHFEFSGGLVNASSATKPGETTEIKLPPIKMSNIGKAEGGVTADVVANEITNELVGAIISAAARAGINKAVEEKKKSFFDKLKGDG
ncbi:MAG: hypothetical protein DRR04_11990 [Gammaproteobacteria bacterium]|nr:MAG: hypothetical protein DRR04_11990 [Gammaproteobacteria bacterium]